jgi:hypothetical protein
VNKDEFDQFEKTARRLLGVPQSFAEEMRELGIHVGMGGKCVTCDQEWPCPASKEGDGGV